MQHCDADIELQMKALAGLKRGVKKGIGIRNNYAYLLDRVKVNLGEKQIFGTQVYRNKEGKYISHVLQSYSALLLHNVPVSLIFWNALTTQIQFQWVYHCITEW